MVVRQDARIENHSVVAALDGLQLRPCLYCLYPMSLFHVSVVP